jgi:hypothetical protein
MDSGPWGGPQISPDWPVVPGDPQAGVARGGTLRFMSSDLNDGWHKLRGLW